MLKSAIRYLEEGRKSSDGPVVHLYDDLVHRYRHKLAHVSAGTEESVGRAGRGGVLAAAVDCGGSAAGRAANIDRTAGPGADQRRCAADDGEGAGSGGEPVSGDSVVLTSALVVDEGLALRL